MLGLISLRTYKLLVAVNVHITLLIKDDRGKLKLRETMHGKGYCVPLVVPVNGW